jgi:hypothetical protein
MRYMMFIKHPQDYGNVQAPASLYQAMGEFIDAATKSGNFIDGAGLQPMAAGSQVKLRGGKITVVDGPYVETKEIVGGYALMEAKTREEAMVIARRFMELHLEHWPTFEGICEVRPLEAEAQQ